MSIGFLEAKKVSSRPLRLQAMGGQMIITKGIMASVWSSESTQHQGETSFKTDNKINKSVFWVHINISLIGKRAVKGI